MDDAEFIVKMEEVLLAIPTKEQLTPAQTETMRKMAKLFVSAPYREMLLKFCSLCSMMDKDSLLFKTEEEIMQDLKTRKFPDFAMPGFFKGLRELKEAYQAELKRGN
ncbi:hypothetical protein ACFL3E_00905 [Patescibacteria group bacterium]